MASPLCVRAGRGAQQGRLLLHWLWVGHTPAPGDWRTATCTAQTGACPLFLGFLGTRMPPLETVFKSYSLKSPGRIWKLHCRPDASGR